MFRKLLVGLLGSVIGLTACGVGENPRPLTEAPGSPEAESLYPNQMRGVEPPDRVIEITSEENPGWLTAVPGGPPGLIDPTLPQISEKSRTQDTEETSSVANATDPVAPREVETDVGTMVLIPESTNEFLPPPGFDE